MNDYDDFNGGIGMNTAMGVYTASSQFNIDTDSLLRLGFSMGEIQTLQYIVSCGERATVANLTQFGLSYDEATRIKYMYDIVTGRVMVESQDQLVKHLRKMFGNRQRIGIQNLKVSKISTVPRKCLVGGIPKDNPFFIYNSIYRDREHKLYKVTNITAGKVYVETSLIPKLPYKHSKKLIRITENSTGKCMYVSSMEEVPKNVRNNEAYSTNTVAEIKEVKKVDNKKVLVIAFDSQYAKVCNRFIIVGSLKRPEFHHGMIEIICIEGTKVYVYAKTASMAELVKYSGGTQRVYDYGFTGGEIQQRLMRVASDIYVTVNGVYASSVPANSDFVIIPKDNKVVNDEDIKNGEIME